MKKKKIVMIFQEDRLKPRIPEECRERIHQGGAHTDKKKYKRNQKHRGSDASLFYF